MSATPPAASLRALFDRARAQVAAEELPHLVMNDPGHPDYVAAYTRVLTRGMDVLFEETDHGLPLIGSFDITENLLLSHTDAEKSPIHRWFSILTACIELLGASEYTYAPPSRTLAALLVDSFALSAASVPGAPLDLVPAVLRALKDTTQNPHERVLAILGELVIAPLTDGEIAAACRELQARHEEFQQPYWEDGERNFFHASRPEFVLGAVMDRWDLPTWLALVETYFPRSPELATATRDRLLLEGKGWLASPAGG